MGIREEVVLQVLSAIETSLKEKNISMKMLSEKADKILSLISEEKEWVSVNRLQKDTGCPQGRTYKHSDVTLLVGQSNCERCKAYCGQNKRGFVYCNPSELTQSEAQTNKVSPPPKSDKAEEV
jgi:hypothetical protein